MNPASLFSCKNCWIYALKQLWYLYPTIFMLDPFMGIPTLARDNAQLLFLSSSKSRYFMTFVGSLWPSASITVSISARFLNRLVKKCGMLHESLRLWLFSFQKDPVKSFRKDFSSQLSIWCLHSVKNMLVIRCSPAIAEICIDYISNINRYWQCTLYFGLIHNNGYLTFF